MAIKRYKPTTNARRGMSVIDYNSILTNTAPEKSLLEPLKKKAGRNNTGSITVRHRGGGHKRKYRIIDFKRNKENIEGRVASIEYDPNRSAFISLINYIDGEKRYILWPSGLKVGMKIISSDNASIEPGNTLPLINIPEGTLIHNVEMTPGKGGQIARSAGSSVQLLGFDETKRYALIKEPSSEVRKILAKCKATIGVVGNKDHSLVNIGKAGRTRHRGFKPTVRGSVMNPNDHPHGGGEGKSPIGRPAPLTPWGKKALGVKTRKNKKHSNKYIVRRRK